MGIFKNVKSRGKWKYTTVTFLPNAKRDIPGNILMHR